MMNDDLFLIQQAQPHVCSLLCPSTRKGDEPWVHHGLCEAMSKRMRDVAQSAAPTPEEQPATPDSSSLVEPTLAGWQDIATAPKDGTELLLTDGRRIADGSWNHGGAMHMPHWMTSIGGYFTPTHWLLRAALPPSPAPREEER